MTKTLRSVELFAGAAGLGLGLAQAGFGHEVVYEQNRDCCQTILNNQKAGHPLVQGWKVVEGDLRNADLSEVTSEPDLLAGGPPCQEFSLGGKHAGSSGERNLWPATIDTVNLLKPRAFMFENVPGLASRHGDYLDYIMLALAFPEAAKPHGDWQADMERLQKIAEDNPRDMLRYRVSRSDLLSADYGTPQKRKRLFLVGLRSDLTTSWLAPEATHSEDELLEAKWINRSYWHKHGIEQPAEMDKAGAKYVRNHNRRPISDLFAQPKKAWTTVRDAISDLPTPGDKTSPTGTLNHIMPTREARTYKGHTGSPIDEPSKTLRAGDHGVSGGENCFVELDGSVRHYSVREAARIQGFPDDYDLGDNWSTGLKMLGNAVSVDVSRAAGQSIKSALI